jgi:hypothetical protein
MKHHKFINDLQTLSKVALLYLLLYFWDFPPFVFGIFHAFMQLQFIELVINTTFEVELNLTNFKKGKVYL